MLKQVLLGIKELIVRPAFAQRNEETFNIPAGGLFSFGTLEELIAVIIRMILIIAGILVFGFMLFGGIQYISSGGDKLQAQQARDKITYAIIGLIIIVAAYAVARVMEVVLGINIFSPKLPRPANVANWN